MKIRDIVKHRTTGKVGVIMDTISMLRHEGRWSVVYDYANFATVVENEDDFLVIGRYDAVADFDGCNAGKGEKCCRFFGMDGVSPTCFRFGEFHFDRVFAQSHAKHQPNRLYPNCKQPA